MLGVDGRDGIYARAHSVSARWVGGRLFYRMQTLLAGRPVRLACERTRAVSGTGSVLLKVSNCLPEGARDQSAARMLPRVEQALEELRIYFPRASVTDVDVALLPYGVRHHDSYRAWRSPDELSLRFAFWWNDADEASMRDAIRSLAHEFSHLAVKAEQRNLPRGEEEAFASLTENCVDLALFGGIDFDAAAAADYVVDARLQGGALRKSVQGSRQASDQLRARLEREGSESAMQFCREVHALRR